MNRDFSLSCAWIFLSPSKLQQSLESAANSDSTMTAPAASGREPLFASAANRIAEFFHNREPEFFQDIEPSMSDEKARETAELWARRTSQPELQAGYCYRGLAFTALDYPSLEHKSAADERLKICSALYGMLGPLDLIKPYRLDLNVRKAMLDGRSLRSFWKEQLANLHRAEGVPPVVDLCSAEYSAIVPASGNGFLRIDFRQYSKGKWRSVSAIGKKMRGTAARWILEHPDADLRELKAAHLGEYRWNEDLSGDSLWVFTENHQNRGDES